MLEQVESHHPASWQPLTRPANRGQITFWENYTYTYCPSLSSGISNSRLLQQCFIKLIATHWSDLCLTNFMPRGLLTSAPTRTKTVQKWDVRSWGHVRDKRLWSICCVCLPHRLPSKRRAISPFSWKLIDSCVCVRVLEFACVCASMMIKVLCFSVRRSVYRLCFLCGSSKGRGLGGELMFTHTHTRTHL